ncbi:unnamed protein product [Adineta steineri]|uniref:SCP domain-containing protein n=1 Tax=Adineta steineri TaxID=433720 RepID=A0A819Z098_9BILA|nr:unnamed protein product [Adineta steineri]CAF3906306.1 unnamed protein product [Adineta steineri]CAF4166644.1 unnamed protein product [Adineta steineri]
MMKNFSVKTRTIQNRLLKNKYPLNGAAAENIALNSGRSAQYTVNQWMKSPKHRASILNPKYNQVGIGASQKNQKIWWTMLLARGSDKCVLPKKS